MAFGYQISRGGQGPGGITNLTAQTTGSKQTITLTQPSNQITVINYSNSATLAVDFNGGTPSTSSSGGNGVQIPPSASTGQPSSFKYDGPALTTFTLIGSAGSALYGIVAY